MELDVFDQKTYSKWFDKVFYPKHLEYMKEFIKKYNLNIDLNGLILGTKYDTPDMHCLFTTFMIIAALDNICNIIIGVLRIFKNALKYIWIRTLISYSCFFLCYLLFFMRNQNSGVILITILISNFLGIFTSIICIKRRISYHQIFYNV